MMAVLTNSSQNSEILIFNSCELYGSTPEAVAFIAYKCGAKLWLPPFSYLYFLWKPPLSYHLVSDVTQEVDFVHYFVINLTPSPNQWMSLLRIDTL